MSETTHGLPAYYEAEACDLNAFSQLIGQQTQPSDVPHATQIEKQIPI